MIKRFLIVAWFAGLSSFLVAYMFGHGFFVVGFAIGICTTASAPAPEFLKGSSKTKANQAIYFLLNVVLGITLCYFIALMWPRYVAWQMEPVSFGLAYGLLHVLITFTLGKLVFGPGLAE